MITDYTLITATTLAVPVISPAVLLYWTGNRAQKLLRHGSVVNICSGTILQSAVNNSCIDFSLKKNPLQNMSSYSL